MTIVQMNYFLTIASQGSINKAALDLNVSQQTLSNAVKAMEKETGETLLRRSHTGIEMTEAGAAFYQFAQQTLMNYHALLRQFSAAKIVADDLYLGVTVVVTSTYFPHFLIQFKRKNPAIAVHTYYPTDHSVEWVREGLVDCGLIIEQNDGVKQAPPISDDIIDIELLPCKPYCWVSSRSPLAVQPSVSLEQLAAGPVVSQEDVDINFLADLTQGYDINYFDFPLATETKMISEIVAENLALYLDFKVGNESLSMAEAFANRPVIALPVNTPRKLQISARALIRKDRLFEPTIQLFINSLADYCGLSLTEEKLSGLARG